MRVRMTRDRGRLSVTGVIRGMYDRFTGRRRCPCPDQDPAVGRGGTSDARGSGLLDDVPEDLPALVRAADLQRRAATVGFDWDAVEEVLAKVGEELDECREALDAPADPAAHVHEIGDLLFACVNLARHAGVDAEQALSAANHRFERRFARIEAGLAARGLRPSRALRAEMELLWEEAKSDELPRQDPCL
jgi:nucleoside triphosphate diphosphatase